MKKTLLIILTFVLVILAACSNDTTTKEATDTKETKESKEVNLYTARHYDVDNELYQNSKKKQALK